MKNKPNGAILIRCSKRLHQIIKEEAEQQGVSLNQYIINLLMVTVNYEPEDSEDNESRKIKV